MTAASWAASATELPLRQDVRPGQVFYVDFVIFGGDPAGADLLLANGGSVSLGLIRSDVYLYADDELLGVYHSPFANTFGVFETALGAYTLFGPTRVNFEELFEGGVGRLEFHPIFDPGFLDPFVNYQLTMLTLATSISAAEFAEASATLSISGIGVRAVPEPSSLSLGFLASLLLAAAVMRRRAQRRTITADHTIASRRFARCPPTGSLL